MQKVFWKLTQKLACSDKQCWNSEMWNTWAQSQGACCLANKTMAYIWNEIKCCMATFLHLRNPFSTFWLRKCWPMDWIQIEEYLLTSAVLYYTSIFISKVWKEYLPSLTVSCLFCLGHFCIIKNIIQAIWVIIKFLVIILKIKYNFNNCYWNYDIKSFIISILFTWKLRRYFHLLTFISNTSLDFIKFILTE